MGREESAANRPQNIILENRTNLRLSGVEEVSHFDDTAVILRTVLGELSIQGEGLKVEQLQVESGEIRISGKIPALIYARESTGLWERLFG